MTAHDPAAALEQAADLIDPDKGGRWITGTFTDDNGGYCILGALSHVTGNEASAKAPWPDEVTAFARGYKRLRAMLGADPAAWNDQDCLDGAQAANVLRKAAEIERAS